ncbi:hypothetical protein DPV78_010907 [Talaromyces pinophilus]|nr:hypothetical protein DPV78_010907 [Talaromyces pinophilus]
MAAAIVAVDVSDEGFGNAAEVHRWRIPGLAIKTKRANKDFGVGATLLLLAGNIEGCTEHNIEAIECTPIGLIRLVENLPHGT